MQNPTAPLDSSDPGDGCACLGSRPVADDIANPVAEPVSLSALSPSSDSEGHEAIYRALPWLRPSPGPAGGSLSEPDRDEEDQAARAAIFAALPWLQEQEGVDTATDVDADSWAPELEDLDPAGPESVADFRFGLDDNTYSCCGDAGWIANGYSATPYLEGGIDGIVMSFMVANGIPNGAVMVLSPDGRLVHIRAYTSCISFPEGSAYSKAVGLPDSDTPFCAEIHTRFRIASISKVFTALTLLKLMEDGRIHRGARAPASAAARIASGLAANAGKYATNLSASGAGLYDVTIEQLLTHSSGMCDGGFGCTSVSGECPSDASCAPGPLDDASVAADLAQVLPVTLAQAVGWLDGQPASNLPGEVWTYSNNGFFVLGDVIAGATTRSYEAYFLAEIAAPLGMTDTTVGDAQIGDRQPREAPYYDEGSGVAKAFTVMSSTYGGSYPGRQVKNLACYGPYNLRERASSGGWLTSAVDMARLAHDLFFAPSSAVLSEAGRTALFAPRIDTGEWWQALGWSVGLAGLRGVAGVEKTGHLTGSCAKLRRLGGERDSAAACFFYVFNRSGGDLTDGPEPEFSGQLEALLDAAVADDWGTDDYLARSL